MHMPSRSRPAEPRPRTPRDGARAAILQATERLLEQGERFTNLGVQRISDEAGVARSAFYLNFTDKADLIVALTETATEEIFSVSMEWLESDSELSAERMAATQANSLRVYRENAAVLMAYQEVAAYDPVVASFWRKRIQAVIEVITIRFREGQEDGRFRRSLDASTAARFIVWGAERMMSEHVVADDGSGDWKLALDIAQTMRAILEPD